MEGQRGQAKERNLVYIVAMTVDQITGLHEGKFFKIYVYGTLHLSIYLENYIAMQAWVESADWWGIYIYMSELDNPIALEYGSEELWKAVVKLLNEHL